jgi:hypothetical protein
MGAFPCRGPLSGCAGQPRRHWEVIRRLVLEPAVSDVRQASRQVRQARKVVGWRQDRGSSQRCAGSPLPVGGNEHANRDAYLGRRRGLHC